MRFKSSQSSMPTLEELLDGGEQYIPPEQRSTILNDPQNPFRTLLENLRTLVSNSVEEDGQEFIVVFSMDQATGALSMGIAKQQQKQEERDAQKYRESIDAAIQTYERAQTHILQHHSRIVKRTKNAKILYESWKKQTVTNSPLNHINLRWMELLDNPRVGKQRSDSKDTAQTLEYYTPILNEESQISEEDSQLDLSYMMEVQ